MIFSELGQDLMHRSLPADTRPLIVTARLDPVSQTYFDELRQQHFPPERNHLAAHLTMFHALPADAIEDANLLLTDVTDRNPSPDAEVCEVRSLGNGVAFTICSGDLERLREEIASAFRKRLTRQDSQRWRPHITVQNKVRPENARELLKVLTGSFEPWTVSVESLDLWYYDRGPWKLVRRFGFKVPQWPRGQRWTGYASGMLEHLGPVLGRQLCRLCLQASLRLRIKGWRRSCPSRNQNADFSEIVFLSGG